MSARPPRTPSYRLHKASGLAVVTLAGSDRYLGQHGTPESRAEYDRVIAEWLGQGRQARVGSDVTVSELLVRYLPHVDSYYVKDGKPTSQAGLIRLAFRVLRKLYGPTAARDFGPLALKAVRHEYIVSGLSRGEVNRRTAHVVRFFGWAVENELVPPSLHYGLKSLKGLRKGRCEAPDHPPVRVVPDAQVDAIKPHVSRQVWAMVELQRITAMRPGEVCMMRTGDIDRSAAVWEYTPGRHKTEHHGKGRIVYLGPLAQATLKPWLRADPDAYLFSPAEAERERREAQRFARKTRVQPSQQNRRKAKPQALADRYRVLAYYHAVVRGCRTAGVPSWGPNRLRHTAATRIRKQFGIDGSRVILGHSSTAVTEVHAEIDKEKAVKMMGEVG